jgi:acetylornithine/succinyldiaminopimelate/putrescine aminotransferase
MLTNRQLFFQHIALPSQKPLALEIDRAEGIYMYDPNGKRYIDLVSGVSVNNIGHCNPKVKEAIRTQINKYMHLMVYGEYIQNPQVKLAEKLSSVLPESLSSTYFVNSGSEAIEGALKLAKRYTNRTEIIAFKNAYHGGTHGALSVLGNESMKYAFRPLLPDIKHLDFNDFIQIDQITTKTACVLIEPIQAEAGIILPEKGYLQAIRKRCNETNTLLTYDEIQMGFSRTSKLFCFELEEVIPDILCLAKGMGGGMPIGAFISSKEIMNTLAFNPVLGHITTFGGHPVCCAAALANLEVLLEDNLSAQAEANGKLFFDILSNQKAIKEIRRAGLMLAIDFNDAELNNKIIDLLLEEGLIVDRFLFHTTSFRIAPPLIITEDEVKTISEIIINCIQKANA